MKPAFNGSQHVTCLQLCTTELLKLAEQLVCGRNHGQHPEDAQHLLPKVQEAHSPQGARNEHSDRCDRLSAINTIPGNHWTTGKDWRLATMCASPLAGVAVQDWQSFFERTGKETIRQEAGAQHCLGRCLKCLKDTHDISLVGLYGSLLTHFLFWLLGIAESDSLASAGWLWRSDQASVPQEGKQLAL